jgi:hypothetical protein
MQTVSASIKAAKAGKGSEGIPEDGKRKSKMGKGKKRKREE